VPNFRDIGEHGRCRQALFRRLPPPRIFRRDLPSARSTRAAPEVVNTRVYRCVFARRAAALKMKFMPRRNHVRVITNAGQRELLAVRAPLRLLAAQIGCSLALLQKWRDGELVPNDDEHAAALQQHCGIDPRAWRLAPDAVLDAHQIALDRFYDALRAHGPTPFTKAEMYELVPPALAARNAGYEPTDPTRP
jgi:hypothetical protein